MLRKVFYRRVVFSIPKILRRYFLYNQDLLSYLSRRASESPKLFLRQAMPEKNPIPGAAIAIKTFGDSFNISAHIYYVSANLGQRHFGHAIFNEAHGKRPALLCTFGSIGMG